MKLLDRYIAGTVIGGTLGALLVLVGLDMFFSVIDQFDAVGRGGYTLSRMLQSVLLTLPQGSYELFPLAALLGSLMGMGTLAGNNELLAMRAAGLSVWRIVRSVLQAGLVMLVVIVFIGEVVAPVADRYSQQMRAMASDNGTSFLGARGLWVRDEDRYINAGRVLAHDRLADLLVYEFDDDHRLRVSTRATVAVYDDNRWLLSDVDQTFFDEGRVRTRHSDQLAWPTLLTPELLGIVRLKPGNMSVTDIDQLVDYLDDNGLDTSLYRYALWGRLMTPVAALVMLFISVPFVFSSLRTVGAGQRIFIGMLLGFGFYIFGQVTTQMGQVYGLPPALPSLLPSLLFIAFGIRGVTRI